MDGVRRALRAKDSKLKVEIQTSTDKADAELNENFTSVEMIGKTRNTRKIFKATIDNICFIFISEFNTLIL